MTRQLAQLITKYLAPASAALTVRFSVALSLMQILRTFSAFDLSSAASLLGEAMLRISFVC